MVTPCNRVYSDNFGNNRIFKVMAYDSVTVEITSKRLKQNKAKLASPLNDYCKGLFFPFLSLTKSFFKEPLSFVSRNSFTEMLTLTFVSSEAAYIICVFL